MSGHVALVQFALASMLAFATVVAASGARDGRVRIQDVLYVLLFGLEAVYWLICLKLAWLAIGVTP